MKYLLGLLLACVVIFSFGEKKEGQAYSVSPVLLTSGTVSSAANLSIDLSAWYQTYSVIQVYLESFLPASDGTDLWCRVSADGSSYDGSAGNYRWGLAFASDAAAQANAGSTSDAQIIMNGTGSHVGNGATNNQNWIVTLFNPGVSTYRPVIQYAGSYYNQTASGNTCIVNGTGSRTTNQVTRGIQFLFSSGNISAGVYRVYGIK